MVFYAAIIRTPVSSPSREPYFYKEWEAVMAKVLVLEQEDRWEYHLEL